MQNKKHFKVMMLIAVNLALLILISDFCTLRSYAANLGENGERIAALQRCLKDNGYYSGEINGLLDFTTKKALRNFKRKNNIGDSDDYKVFSALGLFRQDHGCYRADVEILAKHLRVNGIIEYHFMVSECEIILKNANGNSVYGYIIGITDDINRLIDANADSEQYNAALQAVNRHEKLTPMPF